MALLRIILATLLLLSCTPQPPVAPTITPSSFPSIPSLSSSPSIFSSVPSVPPLHLPPLPFTPQAPFAVWDDLHNEACEEAALIMVHHALQGTTLSQKQAEREIQELVSWQTAHGYSMDVTVEELATIAEQYYGHRARIEENPTPERIRAIVAEGHPVIMPMAGRLLGNPYFRGEGPWYHMLIIRGYRTTFFGARIFITNDPGTRRGEGYEYREDVIMEALHDWTGVKERITDGAKRILIVEE